MAFPDWPTSDGHGMFAYPWLQSASAKFVEHGHRLAGIVIGLFAIGLAIAVFADKRTWIRSLGVLALVCVIAQGILGGYRVLLDATGLAFVHGSFAALVFSLFTTIATATSRAWHEPSTGTPGKTLFWLAPLTSVVLFTQYVLGGLVRHRGMALYEHIAFAAVATIAVVCLVVAVFLADIDWLRGPAMGLMLLVLLQLGLGAGAWIVRFGLGAGEWVEGFGVENFTPVAGSAVQTLVRSGHMLVGMLLFATSVVLSVRTARLGHSDRLSQLDRLSQQAAGHMLHSVTAPVSSRVIAEGVA